MLFGIAVGSNFFKRKRTLCVDLSDINQTPYKAPYPDIFTTFLKNDVGVDLAQVESVSVHPLAPYCMFKLKTDQYHDIVYDKIKDGVRWTGKGRVDVFKCNDVFTEVKVLGVSPETQMEEIGAYLQRYGEVIGEIRRGRVKNTDILDGTYHGKMILSESIPAFVPQTDEGEMWVVRHEGQDQTCFKCLGTGHMSRGCAEEPYQFSKECRLAAKAWRAQLILAAEQERISRQPHDQDEQERQAADQTEKDRVAQAEQDRLAAIQAEKDRLAEIQAEKDRLAAVVQAEQDLAAVQAEKERLVAVQADQDNLAEVQVEQENLVSVQAEQDNLAAVLAEQDIFEFRAEQERLAAVQ